MDTIAAGEILKTSRRPPTKTGWPDDKEKDEGFKAKANDAPLNPTNQRKRKGNDKIRDGAIDSKCC
jgi:hypothetical protein